jgi:hypothetical protein
MDLPSKRPSLREAARRGAAAKHQTRPGTATPGNTPPAVSPAPCKPKPPVVATEQVAPKCGHAVPFELYDDKADKYRDTRRTKVTDRDCPECRQKAHAERTAAETAAAKSRRAAKPKEAGRGDIKCRLPDGSNFNVTWEAAAGQWSGTLTVPGVGAFTGSRTGLFKLNRALDDQYRATLPLEAAPDPGTAVG